MPSPDPQPSPDRWWTVALSEELDHGTPVAVCCDGIELVLFRDSHGQARVLRDQCVHRRAPLSLGRLTTAGLIECPYHGWRYDGATGQCLSIPNLSEGEPVPRSYRTPAYQVREHDGFIHFWSGMTVAAELSWSAQAPALPGARTWTGRALVAYPCDFLLDLLLDAPGAVLDMPGVAIINDHPYGDPVVEQGRVNARFAADHAARAGRRQRTRNGRGVGDYPLVLEVSAALHGGSAAAQLRNDDDTVLVSATIALHPDRQPLTAVCWRGVSAATDMAGAAMGVFPHVDARLARAAPALASRLYRAAAAEAPGSFHRTQRA